MELDPAAFDDCPRLGEKVRRPAAGPAPRWGSTPRKVRRPTHGDYWYRQRRQEFRDVCARKNAPCHLCGGRYGDIDYSAPKGAELSFELDHIVPQSVRPDLAFEMSNWAASHSYCNRTRQNAAIESVADAAPVDLDW